MRVLHILALGGAGGIESLSVDVAQTSSDENYFYFLWGGGKNAERIAQLTRNIQIRKFKTKNAFSEYRYFERYCLENKIECVVVQGVSPMMVVFATVLKVTHPSIKEVLYMHNDATYVLKNSKERIPFKIAYHYCDGCVAISNFVKESVQKAIGDNKKVQVIYNGVNVQNFVEKESVIEDDTQLHMIFVGRLIKEKGVDNILKAMALDYDLNCNLTVVGDGPDRELLEKKRRELGLDAKVDFVGIQWDIPQWLKKADVFVHPCVWNEGFGITLVEAMASGIPCVAFNKGAIPEIIDDQINGFIVKDSTVEALAQKLQEVQALRIKNNEKWEAIRTAARKKAEDFSVENYVQKLSTYIRDLETIK